MPLFKSKAERKLERDLKIRGGLKKIQRQIKKLEKGEQGYLKKAVKAREAGDGANLNFIRNALKKTMSQRRILERQLLTLETAIQLKDQAEAHAQFASSMTELSRAIAEAFGETDFSKSLEEFERAMTQAESMEQRMDIFLDMSEESMEARSEASTVDTVDDAEIDALIEAVAGPSTEGPSLAEELDQIEKEMGG